MQLIEIESKQQLDKFLADGNKLNNVVFKSIDLSDYTLNLLSESLDNCIFLGCKIDPGVLDEIIYKGALVFPPIDGLPYKAFRNSLYCPEDLTEGFELGKPESVDYMFDTKVFNHFVNTGRSKPSGIYESFARRLHDHSITDAKDDFIEGKKVVAVMGGHAVKRNEKEFKDVALLSKILTEHGYVLSSGGGPGAMEATHFGAWFAGRDESELNNGLEIVSEHPDYKDKYNWMVSALEVKEKFPLIEVNGKLPQSLGIPTWVYGHEPPTIFATDIAKYFANSVREDGLLAIAHHAVVFTPGSAGTVQEIFQDGAQNHYRTSGVISPMVFFGKDFWTNKLPAYDLLLRVSAGRDYHKMVTITDSIDEAVEFIFNNPPE